MNGELKKCKVLYGKLLLDKYARCLLCLCGCDLLACYFVLTIYIVFTSKYLCCTYFVQGGKMCRLFISVSGICEQTNICYLRYTVIYIIFVKAYWYEYYESFFYIIHNKTLYDLYVFVTNPRGKHHHFGSISNLFKPHQIHTSDFYHAQHDTPSIHCIKLQQIFKITKNS